MIRDRILRDANGSISDPQHLQSHVHLKKKHNVRKINPIFADKSLMRDLIVLQRSRTLRDPSEKSSLVNGRRSITKEMNGRESVQRNDAACEQPTSESSDESFEDKGGSRKQDRQIFRAMHVQLESGNDDVALSCSNNDRRHVGTGKYDRGSGVNVRSRGKRRKFQGARRNAVSSGYEKNQNDVSVASNSFPQKYSYSENSSHEFDDPNMNDVKTNGCGVPWNCSKIHDRGKPNLDKAGKNLFCGLSEPKKRVSMSHRREISDMRVMSENSSSSTVCNSLEVLPLLLNSDSQMDSTDNFLNQKIDLDLMSEDKSCNNDGHVNFTRKYMPRTFKDLIGQNLVAQSLSNAVSRGQIGPLYVFYGPQGTGKTSCARIFARELNCRSRAGPKPCGFCDSCVAHDRGKSDHVREIGRVSSNFELENIVQLFDPVNASRHQSHYKVLIFDECDALAGDHWSKLVKVIDRAPKRVVFVLICSNLDVLPRVIISRSHKFFFPKLKNSDIVRVLQFIATKEELEIDMDALTLIASTSNGSLRDAEMTLDQLSLLGEKISPQLVRELAGLTSDEKLVDLLDLALSADTVNTVKSLREIRESGVEPLALMSQLAAVITDILSGKFDSINYKETPLRKLFGPRVLTKRDTEKLRRALKTLSEAEKQLRVSSDKMTWLTAAILQLVPDRGCMSPNSKHIPDSVLNDSAAVNMLDAHRDNADDNRNIRKASSCSISCNDVRKPDERDDRNLSLVRAKVSLAQVIRLAEGYSRNSGLKKLEKDSLRLESRSRTLLCWNNPRRTSQKRSSRLRIRRRRPRMLLKLVSRGKCL